MNRPAVLVMVERETESERPRRRVRRWWLRLVSIAAVAAVGYLAVTAYQVVSASNHDDALEGSRHGAIVVLGAAQYDGRPSPVLRSRLDHAKELFDKGVSPTVVVTGFKRDADRFTEAYAGFKYLREAGIPEDDLLVVDDGSTTWESMQAVKRVLDRRGVEDVVLVSSRYHNRRLQGIAGELGLDAGVSAVGKAVGIREVAGETLRVAVGQVLGYRRMHRLTS